VLDHRRLRTGGKYVFFTRRQPGFECFSTGAVKAETKI
jgi:hypothetical protein